MNKEMRTLAEMSLLEQKCDELQSLLIRAADAIGDFANQQRESERDREPLRALIDLQVEIYRLALPWTVE